MKQIDNYDISQIPLYKAVFVVTSSPAYEMDRVIFVEAHPDYDSYTILEGYHCSCYDFDGSKWEATILSKEELPKFLDSWDKEYNESVKIILPMIRGYISH